MSDMEELVVEIVAKARRGVLASPDSSRAWRNFATVLDAHEYWADAEIAYRRAIELAPEDWWCAYNLAVVLESRGTDAEEILALYRRFAELEPNYPPVRERIAIVLARKGDLKGAAEAHRAALALDPKLTYARRSLGQVLISLGDARGAIAELEQTAREAPADGPTQAGLAQAYTLTGDAARASAAAARARELKDTLVIPDPLRLEVVNQGRSASLASARAADRMRAGDYAGALEDLKIVLRSTPERPTLHERLATVYRQLGQPELALQHQQEAQRLRAGR
jgi:tetratricopeptide (TPR) repeat protein